jgi:hypothetical protein
MPPKQLDYFCRLLLMNNTCVYGQESLGHLDANLTEQIKL